jgi:hypothetical protein
MDDLEPSIFKPIASLIPGEVGFVFRVPDSRIGTFEMPTPGVTSYQDFKGPGKVRTHEYHWADMIFTHNETGPGSYHSFYFHEDRRTLRQTPVSSLSKALNRPHKWDNVIVFLGALEDATQPLTLEVGGETVELARLFERLYKLPESVISSDIDLEVFISNTPFPRTMVRTDIPVPGEVRWRDRNISGGIVALHPYIEFAEQQTGASKMLNWGTVRSRSPMGSTSRRVYKETNQVTWQDHVITADVSQDPQTGLHVLRRETVRVPDGFQQIKDLSN